MAKDVDEVETVFPVSFYMRAGNEIVMVDRKGAQVIFRLNDRQLVHLACDTNLQLSKMMLAALQAKA